GISLFLAHLGYLTSEERYTNLARLALHTAVAQFEESRTLMPNATGNVGVFSGDGGLVYTLLHLAILWREPALLRQAEEMLIFLKGNIGKDRTLDMLGGAAGYLCVMVDFYKHTGSLQALESANACAENLLACAQPMPKGIAWASSGMKISGPLTGFSHGA